MIQASAHGEPIKLPCTFCIHVKEVQGTAVGSYGDIGSLVVRFLLCEDGVWALPESDFLYSSITLLKKTYDVLKFLFSFPPFFF